MGMIFSECPALKELKDVYYKTFECHMFFDIQLQKFFFAGPG
jgi:hypothetical protein